MNLQKIKELASDSTSNIADLLRQCQILAAQIDSPEFEVWVTKELDGYSLTDEIPDYRITTAGACGFFIGAFGVQYPNRPIPPAMMDPEDRHWARSIRLKDPIAVYEDLIKNSASGAGELVVEWHANLVVKYQSRFFKGGDPHLYKAWQSLTRGHLLQVAEAVRNRVLRLALTLEKQIPKGIETPLPPAQKEVAAQLVQNIIVNGNVGNIAGGTDIRQAVSVVAGDIESLKSALFQTGMDAADVAELEGALKSDGTPTNGKLGSKTSKWLGGLVEKAAGGMGQLALSTASNIVPKLLSQYLGLPQ
jgi:hypothetical protein